MAIKLADAFISITADSKGLDRDLGKAKKSVNAFANVMQGVLQGVGQAAFRGFTSALSASVREVGKMITASSDLTESMNKTAAVFGDSAVEVLAWSRDSAKALGQSRQEALEAAATFGNLFTSMGVGRGEAARLSKAMVELASDLASFNNVSPEEALTALRSGIVGEIEPLRRFGVSLSAAAVESKALEMGLAATSKELTEQDKILARYELILQMTGNAQGDFARNTNELANQQRIWAANMRNAAATIGDAFAPVATTILRGLNRLAAQVMPYGEGMIDSLAAGMARAIVSITPVLLRIRQLFTYLLKPGSPPRLLPDLDKWGREAMEVYLRGWTDADLSIFDTLASSLETVIRSFAGAGQIKETDLVSRVFGTRDAIARAIAEFQRAGSASESALRAIERAAGPAGGAVRGLISSYLDLQTASRAAAQAQEELTAVTERYDAALSPLDDKLRAVQSQQADMRDQQRAEALNATIADVNTREGDRRLAQLELEEIELRRQMRLLEDERNTAVDAAQDKLDAARREEEAKQQAYNAQAAAVDQQVKANQLIEEERNLRQRLADEALAAQERALRELEAAQREVERAEEQRRDELERIYQAQLDYNMQIADTPGKIALLKQELARYTVGSAEYYGILTQIAALEQSLAKEREAAAGAGAGALFGPLEEAVGEGGVLPDTLEGVNQLTEALDALFVQMEESPEELTGFWKDVADVIADLGDALGIFNEFFGDSLDANVEKAETSGDKITELQENRHAQWLNLLRMFIAITKKDWGALWDALKEQTRLANEEQRLVFDDGMKETNKTIGERLGDWRETWVGRLTELATLGETWGSDMEEAAKAAIANFWGGITQYWRETIVPGWEAKMQWLRDMLPGSEPKDPSSPLRNLGRAGEAIVEQIQAGMERAALGITPQTAAGLTAPAIAGAAGNVTNVYFDQVFQTQPDWGMTRAASRDGVLAALRARGG